MRRRVSGVCRCVSRTVAYMREGVCRRWHRYTTPGASEQAGAMSIRPQSVPATSVCSFRRLPHHACRPWYTTEVQGDGSAHALCQQQARNRENAGDRMKGREAARKCHEVEAPVQRLAWNAGSRAATPPVRYGGDRERRTAQETTTRNQPTTRRANQKAQTAASAEGS